MRTLLVCTDFSGPAYHAARYAIVLAQQYSISNITLFHGYRRFATATAMPPHPDEEAEQVKAINLQLEEQKQNLQANTSLNQIQILIRAEKLSLSENINQLCEEENADMIIVGVTGSSHLERGLMGSTMLDIVKNSKFPVCIVPGAAPLSPVTHVLFAYDFKHRISKAALTRLDETLSLLNAKVTIFNVDKNMANDDVYSQLHVLEKHQPLYKSVEGDDVVENIIHYSSSHNVSMIVAIPRHFNFLEQVIHRSTTQQLIYQSMVPVLSLHD